MANAAKDGNGASTIIGALNTTGTSLVRVQINATNHGLKINDNTTGTNHGPTNALRDENGVPGLLVVSSSDGVTPVSLYTDSSGNLLIQSS